MRTRKSLRDLFPDRCVGYIRVSTEGQEREGDSLDTQASRIRHACKRARLELLGTHEDTHTGEGLANVHSRMGMQEAIAEAHRHEAILVVTQLDRLARGYDAQHHIICEQGVRVYELKSRNLYTRDNFGRMMERQPDRSRQKVVTIRRTTKEGIAQRKLEGVQLGNRKNLPTAQRKGLKSRLNNANIRTEQVAAVLQRTADWEDLTHKALADLLNREGVRPERSETWSSKSVRSIRAAAERLIEEQEMLAGEPDDFIMDMPSTYAVPVETSSVRDASTGGAKNATKKPARRNPKPRWTSAPLALSFDDIHLVNDNE